MEKNLAILIITILLIACQNKQGQNENVNNSNSMELATNIINSVEGLYVDKTNKLEIRGFSKDTIEIKLFIANQLCAMPSFSGLLGKISNNEFEGLVTSNFDNFKKDTHHMIIIIKDSLVEVKSNDSWELWQLGASCWVEGEYLKTLATTKPKPH